MKYGKLIGVLTALIGSITNCEPVKLNLDNFESEIGCDLYKLQNCQSSIKTQWLIMFMAPWCGHCKRAKPQFQAFGKYVANQFELDEAINYQRSLQGKPKIQGKAIKAGIVDCDQQGQLCRQLGIKGFPTFILLTEDRKGLKYKGQRNFDGFANFTVYHDPIVHLNAEPVSLSHSFLKDLAAGILFFIKKYWLYILGLGILLPALLGYFLGNYYYNRVNRYKTKDIQKQARQSPQQSQKQQPEAAKKDE